MKTISLQDYAKIVGYKGSYPTTLEQIQDFVENELDCMLWDYPLEEADYELFNPHALFKTKKECKEYISYLKSDCGLEDESFTIKQLI